MNQTVAQLLKTKEFPLRLYDSNRNETYFENSNKYWARYEYDSNRNLTYSENSIGTKHGISKSQSTCDGKTVEIDGIKYKLTRVWQQFTAQLFSHSCSESS